MQLIAGDVLDLAELTQSHPETSLVLGPGLLQHQPGRVLATKCGRLNRFSSNRFLLDNYQKRYVPALNDSVIGVITGKGNEQYRVDIGAAHPAILPMLAFENATKRNRPNLKAGQLIYAHVCLAERDMEAELTCISPATQQADGFGELKNGYVFTCSLPLARSLINTQHPLLQALGDRLPFEVAVGYNGRVWVNSDTTRHLILVVNALQNLEHHVQLDKNQAVKMVQQLFDNMDIE